MILKKRWARFLLIGGTLAACLLVAAGAVLVLMAQSPDSDYVQSPQLILDPALPPEYPVNENGQTYGAAPLARTPDEEPDLISAMGTSGEEGYVLKTDLDGFQPQTPEEAIKWQNERPDFWMIPLYKSDGETVIGEFKVGGGTAVELTPEEAAQGITLEDKMNALLSEQDSAVE